jgi:hypothetical protein
MRSPALMFLVTQAAIIAVAACTSDSIIPSSPARESTVVSARAPRPAAPTNVAYIIKVQLKSGVWLKADDQFEYFKRVGNAYYRTNTRSTALIPIDSIKVDSTGMDTYKNHTLVISPDGGLLADSDYVEFIATDSGGFPEWQFGHWVNHVFSSQNYTQSQMTSDTIGSIRFAPCNVAPIGHC